MENEMIVIRKADFNNLIEQLKIFNSNFEKLNFNKEDEKFFTRKEAQQYYNMSERETAKLFNKILKDKVVDIGKEQRLAKVNIDQLFRNGVVLK